MGDLSDPLGPDPAAPTSQHWFPSAEEVVPLKAWAEARSNGGGASEPRADEEDEGDGFVNADSRRERENRQRLLGGQRIRMTKPMRPEWLRQGAWRELAG